MILLVFIKRHTPISPTFRRRSIRRLLEQRSYGLREKDLTRPLRIKSLKMFMSLQRLIILPKLRLTMTEYKDCLKFLKSFLSLRIVMNSLFKRSDSVYFLILKNSSQNHKFEALTSMIIDLNAKIWFYSRLTKTSNYNFSYRKKKSKIRKV